MGHSLQKSSVDVVVIALGSPLLVGVYENNKLIKKIETKQKTSEVLPILFRDLLQRFNIKSIYFARGPGSFMAIKLVYIFLKTLQITSGVQLFGCEGFVFNNNMPIKAVGNLYFVKENGKIVTKKLSGEIESNFFLPKRLVHLACSEDISPLYVIPAVKA